MKKRASKNLDYSKHKLLGHVPEQDGGITVRFIKIIDGFECHDIKKRPDLSNEQWVEVIHRNGERSRGPVETFAWGIHPCKDTDRLEYGMHGHRKPVHDILDLEITHYRTTPTPPDDWVNGRDPWPFNEERAAA